MELSHQTNVNRTKLFFNRYTRCANYRINSISIPCWLEKEWCVISFFTKGDIVFAPGLNCIDRETFNILKDWYWINEERLSYEPIREILKLYDSPFEGIVQPVNTDNIHSVAEYAEIARKIDSLDLYPFAKTREFIDGIEN